MLNRWLQLVAAAALLTALVAGCGSGSETQPPSDVGPHIDRPIELTDCTDWEAANTEERLGTIRQIKNFAGGPVVGGEPNPASGTGAVLDDKQAYDLMERFCGNDYARGFKLYKLYTRAAAFIGRPEQ
jgi:hypothetical protein